MSKDNSKTYTHFGYQQVSETEKTHNVKNVFDSVANKYDLMNDVMSLGIHRIWKQFTVQQARVRVGQKILDIAGGTGDLALAFSRLVGEQGKIILADINATMLGLGRDRLLNAGCYRNLTFVQANAETLPFKDNFFDRITIAFGLRNVTQITLALAELNRVLKPGGWALILEFSRPVLPGFASIYDWYSFNILPKLGKWIANDAASYRYLAESIRMHPEQETLKQLMLEAGFDQVNYFNLTGGIVALHQGYKY